jgi:radical SAM protein with 4Fe4S-binding SPASM domain
MEVKVIDNKDVKIFSSPAYNYIFRKEDGFFLRWGRTKEDNPKFGPFGPELLDISITSRCYPGTCKYCYQNAKKDGLDMSVDYLRKLLEKIPPSVGQIAWGGGEPTMHPDFVEILRMTREDFGIVPNYTTNGHNLTKEIVEATAKYSGAVATSYHGDWDVTLQSVNKFTEAGMDQTNIHFVLSEDTIDEAIWLCGRPQNAFKNVNAVVFLLYKPQGRAPKSGILRNESKILELLKLMRENKSFKMGFDSCSVPMLYKFASGKQDIEMLELLAEPCESTLFSYYIDVDGKGYPCSFCKSHVEPINVNAEEEDFNFLRDVWYNHITTEFRRKNMNSTQDCGDCKYKSTCGKCVVYPDISICDRYGKKVMK